MITVKQEYKAIVDKLKSIFNSVKLKHDEKIDINFDNSLSVPKKQSIIALRDSINKLEAIFSNNCNCTSTTPTDCGTMTCQKCQSASDTALCQSCQTQKCQSYTCQSNYCQSTMCQISVCEACQIDSCESCQTCQTCQTCQSYSIGYNIKELVLTDDKYKMSDLFPDTYDTMEFLPVLIRTDYLTTAKSMFAGCKKLKTIPYLNTENITDTDYMFYDCKNITNIKYMNMDKVETGNYMFSGSGLKIVPDINLNFKSIEGMFMNCKDLTDVSNMNTSRAENMTDLYKNCKNLTGDVTLNLQSIADHKKANNIFYGTSVKNVYFTHTNIINITEYMRMIDNISDETPYAEVHFNTNIIYNNSKYITSLILNSKIDKYNYRIIKKMPFNYITNLLTTMDKMFKDCSNIETVNIDCSNVTSAVECFMNCESLENVYVSNPEQLTNVDSMFENCINLKIVPLDTHNCEYMYRLFAGSGIEEASIDLSNAKVINDMFIDCNNLKHIHIYNNVNNLDLTLLGCNENVEIKIK